MAPNRFCAICGKDIDDSAPHYAMCLECYLKENPLFFLPSDLSLKICLDCGSYAKKDQWNRPESPNLKSLVFDAIDHYSLKNIKHKREIRFLMKMNEESKEYNSRNLVRSVVVDVEGFLNKDEKIKHNQAIKINLNYELCQNCLNLRGGNYFTSILQLRVKDDTSFHQLEKIVDDVQFYVEEQFENDNKQYISKIVDKKYGLDFYLSTNELMNHIITYLRKRYHFILKRSKKLMGRDIQRGKNVYRLKTLIKFLPISKNDLILINNKKYKVDKITHNKVILRTSEGSKEIKPFKFFTNERITFLNETGE
ncbi:MAG: hypothetical protein GF353_18195 [Candidatus Lokiarchaeota archaeon]|nr:hypothetical protein [Candidatus Lokiarchaeota archaeon]